MKYWITKEQLDLKVNIAKKAMNENNEIKMSRNGLKPLFEIWICCIVDRFMAWVV